MCAKPKTHDNLNVNRLFKSIRLLFLLFAGVAMVSHTIIPHDHHFSCSEGGVKDTCPVENERSGHHPLFPGHCHAFNDLAAEKFIPINIRLDIQNAFVTVIWYPDYIIPGVQISQTSLPAFDKPFQQIFVTDFFPLRAPPSIS